MLECLVVTRWSLNKQSRALQENPSKKVADETKKKILSICEEMRYYPNMHTVRMLSKRSNTVALFVPAENMHMKNPSGMIDFNLASAIGGVECELAKHSVYLTIASISEDFLARKEYLKFARGKMVDGILIWGWTESYHYLFELIEEDIPMAMLQSCDSGAPLSQVNAQDCEGMKRIVKHVYDLGHRNLAFIPPSETSRAGQNRRKGFIEAAKKHKLDFTVSRIGGFSFEHGRAAIREIMDMTPKVTCVIAANDMVAYGCLEEAATMGLKVPDELSVTGADGLRLPGYQKLTTYISPAFEIGVRGARLLMDLVDRKDVASLVNENLPVEFIEGNTTARVVFK
jgi:LacI family transcriptional regulator